MNALREQLTGYFRAGVAAAGPRLTLPAHLPKAPPAGKTLVLGCGKSAAEMAAVAVEHLAGPVSGAVVTRHGHGVGHPIAGIDVIEARHPVPDAQSLAAGARLMALAATAGPQDRVIFLVSGGGSALLCAPAEGITLAEKQEMTDHLVRSGVPIGEINLVRRHLSRIKGGRLAAIAGANGAELLTFVISDVPGDDPALVASGPSIASAFAPDAAVAILEASGWRVSSHIARAVAANRPPPVPPHPVRLLATNADALRGVAARAGADGWNVVSLGAMTGDAATTGAKHAMIAQRYAAKPGRHLLLSGGELTVAARADGRGGPNLEYLLGLLARLAPSDRIAALAGDSDGIDGTCDNAGGFIAAGMASPAECAAALAVNRSHDLVAALGGLVTTGPTRTNVNDIRMIAVKGHS